VRSGSDLLIKSTGIIIKAGYFSQLIYQGLQGAELRICKTVCVHVYVKQYPALKIKFKKL